MTTKTLKNAYWTATSIFVLWLIFDGIGGIIMVQAGKDSLTHLGYPLYLLAPIGVAKLLAAAAILQTKYRTIKEWAFAGYAINCIGAFVSRVAVGDSTMLIIMPLIFLALAGVPYYFWKRREYDKAR